MNIYTLNTNVSELISNDLNVRRFEMSPTPRNPFGGPGFVTLFRGFLVKMCLAFSLTIWSLLAILPVWLILIIGSKVSLNVCSLCIPLNIYFHFLKNSLIDSLKRLTTISFREMFLLSEECFNCVLNLTSNMNLKKRSGYVTCWTYDTWNLFTRRGLP